MAYCDRCGTYAALDPAAMCAACRAAWRPSAPALADLGTRTHASTRSVGQSADLRLLILIVTFPQVSASSRLSPAKPSGAP